VRSRSDSIQTPESHPEEAKNRTNEEEKIQPYEIDNEKSIEAEADQASNSLKITSVHSMMDVSKLERQLPDLDGLEMK